MLNQKKETHEKLDKLLAWPRYQHGNSFFTILRNTIKNRAMAINARCQLIRSVQSVLDVGDFNTITCRACWTKQTTQTKSNNISSSLLKNEAHGEVIIIEEVASTTLADNQRQKITTVTRATAWQQPTIVRLTDERTDVTKFCHQKVIVRITHRPRRFQ